MKVDGLLHWSVWSMVVALLPMIICLARSTPRTIGLSSWGPGWGSVPSVSSSSGSG